MSRFSSADTDPLGAGAADDEPLLDPEPESDPLNVATAPAARLSATSPRADSSVERRPRVAPRARPTLQLAHVDDDDDDDEQLLDAGAPSRGATGAAAPAPRTSAKQTSGRARGSEAAYDEVALVAQPGTPDGVTRGTTPAASPAVTIGARRVRPAQLHAKLSRALVYSVLYAYTVRTTWTSWTRRECRGANACDAR